MLSSPVLPVMATPAAYAAGPADDAAGPSTVVPPSNPHLPDHLAHIWLVIGPAGCGKTTIAQSIADLLQAPYLEGDQYHPPANIAKMTAGIPLTDDDRWDWLTRLRDECLAQISVASMASARNAPASKASAQSIPPSKTPARNSPSIVLTCSALKRKYRDVIRVANYYEPSVRLHFVYLHASEEVLVQRVRARVGHYMKESMVKSQWDTLELPCASETDIIWVDVGQGIDAVKAEVAARVTDAMRE